MRLIVVLLFLVFCAVMFRAVMFRADTPKKIKFYGGAGGQGGTAIGKGSVGGKGGAGSSITFEFLGDSETFATVHQAGPGEPGRDGESINGGQGGKGGEAGEVWVNGKKVY